MTKKSRRTILLVDPDEDFRQELDQLLTEEGFGVRQADSGTRALNLTEEQKAHLCLISQSLPDIQGSEVLSLMRDHHGERTLLLLSGQTAELDENNKELLKEIQCDGFVPKDHGLEPIVAFIKMILEKNEERVKNALWPSSHEQIIEEAEGKVEDLLDESDKEKSKSSKGQKKKTLKKVEHLPQKSDQEIIPPSEDEKTNDFDKVTFSHKKEEDEEVENPEAYWKESHKKVPK